MYAIIEIQSSIKIPDESSHFTSCDMAVFICFKEGDRSEKKLV